MPTKLSYMLFAGKINDDPRVTVPGLFQWTVAFDEFGKSGTMEAEVSKDVIERYDVVHVNYTPGNASYVSVIRNALGNNSSTKLIVNVDFATGMWNRIDPFILEDQLLKADMIFHVESNGALRLRRLMDGRRPVHTIPHPVNTDWIKTKAKSERAPTITCQYHRYMDTWAEYWWGLREIKKEYPEFKIVLMNYTPSDENKHGVPIVGMFDRVVPYLRYHEYINVLSDAFINVDLTPDYTYGRGVVDAAALSVPTIGSDTIEAMNNLFPTLTTNNDMEVDRKVRELVENEDMRHEVANNGMAYSEYYSLKNSYTRMTNALEDA